MNDFQSLLVFVTAIIGITSILLVILQNNVLTTIENKKRLNRKKSNERKGISLDMKNNGINLVKEELLKREYKKHQEAQKNHHERSFVVYDTETGETFNYYQKKR